MRYTLIVRWSGEQFEASVPEFDHALKAYGTTYDETLVDSQRLIVHAQMAETMRAHIEQKNVA